MAFQKGMEKIGGRLPGSQNKSKRDVRELMDELGDIREVFRVLFEMALEKDPRAAKILAEYYFGKPTQVIDFGDKSFTLTVNSQSDKTRQILQGNE